MWNRCARASLAYRDRSLGVVAGLGASAGMLAAGVSLPIFAVKTGWFVFTAETSYSILAGVANLWASGEWFVGGLLFVFSVVFPFVKLIAITLLYFAAFGGEALRGAGLAAVGAAAKWSMVDVFVVALLIVAVSSERLAVARSGLAIGFFVASLALSTAVFHHVKRKLGEAAMAGDAR
ncbi:MAG: paraquat-inducible protein A [Caulobacterales bacterium]|nr:paraquat-inducible protein A [Caulobacterales bacterium]